MVEDSDGQFMSIIDRDAFEYVYSEVRNLIPAPIAPLKTTGTVKAHLCNIFLVVLFSYPPKFSFFLKFS